MTTLEELLDYLEAREKAADFKGPGDRLKAALLEIDEDDIPRLLGASTLAAAVVSKGDPSLFTIAMLTIGLEMGRELERRA